MSIIDTGTSSRKQAEELIDLLAHDKKPSGPVRTEIMSLAREIASTLPVESREKIRTALNSLSGEIVMETPKEVQALFSGTRSELMQAAPDIANAIMEERFKSWKGPPLEREQKKNIQLAIIARISEGKFAENILSQVEGGISTISKGLKDIFAPGKIEALAKSVLEGSKEKSGGNSIEAQITTEIMKMVDAGLIEIQKAHESNPQPEGFQELLKYGEALSKYTYGTQIPPLLRQYQGRVGNNNEFEQRIRKRLMLIDERLLPMEDGKNAIFDVLAKMPEIGSERIIESMTWLFSIPVFSAFARGFLGIKENDEPIHFIKKEIQERRLVGELREFGLNGKSRNDIPLLSHLDLSELKYRDLRNFFRKMREYPIDLKEKDFWKKVFIEGKIAYEKDGKPKILEFPKWIKEMENLASIKEKLNTFSNTITMPDTPHTPLQTKIETPPPGGEKSDRTELMKQGLKQANGLPFRVGNEEVSFSGGELRVGNSRYRLEGVGMLTVGIESLTLRENMVILGHRFGTSEVSKNDVIDALPELLALAPGNKTEVRGDDGTLRITRSA